MDIRGYVGANWKGGAAMFAVTVLLAGLYFQYERQELSRYRHEQREKASSRLTAVVNRLESALGSRLSLAHGIESYVYARGTINSSEFNRLARALLQSSPEQEWHRLLLTRGTVIKYAYPAQQKESFLARDWLRWPGQSESVKNAIRDKMMTLVGPLTLDSGNMTLVGHKPIYVGAGSGQRFWGLASVFIDWQSVLREAGIDNHSELEIALKDTNGGEGGHAPFYGRDEVFGEMPVTVSVAVPGGEWMLAAVPRAGWIDALPDQTFQRTVALLVILLLSAAAMFLAYYPVILNSKVRRAVGELKQGYVPPESATKRHKAEITQTEWRMRRLIDALPFPVVVTAVEDGRYLYANDSAAELFQETLDDKGQSSMDYYEDPNQRQAILDALHRDGKVIGYEVAMRGKKGRRFWALLSIIPLSYDFRDALLVAITDISERKKMEIILTESERTLRSIFNSVQTPMAIARRSDGLVLRLNAAAKRLSGVSDAHIGKFKAHDIYCNPDDRHMLIAILDKFGYVQDMEVCMRSLQGEERTMLLSATYLDYRNEPCILSSYTEITERKRMEQALQKANREAEQAIRSKNEFLATMSHEIRTPLNGVLTMLRLLERTELNDEQIEYVEAINFSGEALLTILNDVLDLSKIEAGMLELEETDFDVHRLLDDMVRLMKHNAEKNRVALSLEYDARIPRQLRGDPTRIRQVLFNLLGNAIKFTEVGEVVLKASYLGASDAGIALEFRVRDTGIGIPKTLQETLFDSFTQADSSVARQYGGTGLGLAICRRMVEIMGGKIGVESEQGRGSEFWFRLVLSQASGSDAVSAVTSQVDSLPPLKVLLVEDDAINRRAGTMLLRQEGAEVVAAADGYEALERFRDGGFDVVLMDVRMPGMDGLETTQRLRGLPGGERVPVLALTADATQENLERCMGVGMSGVLTKPIHIDRLREALCAVHSDDADRAGVS